MVICKWPLRRYTFSLKFVFVQMAAIKAYPCEY